MEYHGFDTVNDAPARVSDEELNRKLHHHRMEGSEAKARRTYQWKYGLTAGPVRCRPCYEPGRRVCASTSWAKRTCAVADNKLSSESGVMHAWKLLPLPLPLLLHCCCEML